MPFAVVREWENGNLMQYYELFLKNVCFVCRFYELPDEILYPGA